MGFGAYHNWVSIAHHFYVEIFFLQNIFILLIFSSQAWISGSSSRSTKCQLLIWIMLYGIQTWRYYVTVVLRYSKTQFLNFSDVGYLSFFISLDLKHVSFLNSVDSLLCFIIRSRDVISNPNCIEISIFLKQKKLITE